MALLLIVLPLLLAACDKQQKSPKETASGQAVKAPVKKGQPSEKTVPLNAEEEENEETPQDTITDRPVNFATATLRNYEGGAIAAIRKNWRYQPVELIHKDMASPGIEQFAFAFVMESHNIEFPPIHAMQHYLVGPEHLDTDNFSVNCQPRSGYIRCDALTQFNLYAEMCYWKRNNGHCLFGVFLAEEHEIPSKNDQLTLFYDYDPVKKTMTPEPAITDLIEQKTHSFDKYRAHMPEKGKDIRISAYEVIYEEDSAEETEFLLKWDGNAFKWAK